MYIKDLIDLYPRNQIHIVKGEEYYHNRVDVMERVFSFLAVGKTYYNTVTAITIGGLIQISPMLTSGRTQKCIVGYF